MTTLRFVNESPIYQGEDEEIAYNLTVTPWGSNPTNVSVAIYDKNRTDLSSTCLKGSVIVEGDIVTTPVVYNLTAGRQYRLEVLMTLEGNILEAYAVINGEY